MVNSSINLDRTRSLKNRYRNQLKFLQFHFPQEENDYFSFVPIYCRGMQYTYNTETMRRRRKGMYQSGSLNTKEIALLDLTSNAISDQDINILSRLNGVGTASKDYYISANGMRNPKERKNSTLFRLYNIVIDIDCHHETDPVRFHAAIQALLNSIEGEVDLVKPNTIVQTGRGVQLWYALVPSSYKLKKAYSCVRADIIGRLKSMIGDSDLLRPFFKIDPVASRNVVGIFRMPGSKNIVAGKTSTFKMVHSDRLDLMLYMDEHAETDFDAWKKQHERKRKEKQVRSTPAKISAFEKEAFLKERTELIEDLIRLRGENDIGYRDTYALIYLSAYLTAGRPLTEAWSALMDLNRMLPHPLHENELTSYMSACCRKRGYRFSTRTVLDRLDVTADEKDILGVKACTNKKQARKQEVHKRKAKRNSIILDLADHDYNQREIARRAGCSQATVCRVLKNRDTVEVEQKNTNTDEVIQKKKEEKRETQKNTEEVKKESAAADAVSANPENTHIIKKGVVVDLLHMSPEEREAYRQAWLRAHPRHHKDSSRGPTCS